jgi:drug/metabolite transporter (DMT)-like permease
MMKWKGSSHPYAMLTILFWSLAYVWTRLALRFFSPYALGFLRYAFASCALLVLIAAVRAKPPRKEDLAWFLLSGASGFFFYMIAFNTGCRTVAASTGSVVLATVPVLSARLARLVYGEKLSAVRWLATCGEFSGVAVLTLLKGGLSLNRGILWLLGAALSLSVYNLLQRRLTKAYPPLVTCAFSIFAGTAMLAVFLPGSIREARRAPPVQILYVAALGVFSSAVAFVSWSKAISKAKKVSSVSNYMFLTPFLTSLFGFLIAGETPGAATAAGGAVILSGLLIFQCGDGLLEKARKPKIRF